MPRVCVRKHVCGGGGGAPTASPSRQEMKAGTVEVRQASCHQHDKIKALQGSKITKHLGSIWLKTLKLC